MQAFDYRAPTDLDEALQLLATEGARPLAGGTDLLVQMKERKVRPSLLVDVKRVPELNRLELRDGELHIGAAVPLTRVCEELRSRSLFPALLQACEAIGSLQVRNRGTLGGNICNAAPSADTAPPLLCYEARAVIAGRSGEKEVKLSEFFTGPGSTVLSPGELLVRVVVPLPPPGSRSIYLRFTIREEMDIALVGAAALVVPGPGGEWAAVRIALGAVAPTPIRAEAAESLLSGKAPTAELIEQAATAAAAASRPITDHRASAEYRRELVKVLTRRCLNSLAASP